MGKVVVRIYSRILLSHRENWNLIICRDVDEPRVCHTEWSKSEKEKQRLCFYSIKLHASFTSQHIMSTVVLSCFSHAWLFTALWTVACRAPLSMGFSRQEYWSGLPCPPSGALPDPGIEPTSLKSPALAGGFFTTSATWEAPECLCNIAIFLLD